MNRKNYQTAAYIILFGGLWGICEILLGNVLQVFELPFKGNIMSAIGCIICLTGASLMPCSKKCPIIGIGIIAILVRMLPFGVFKIHILVSMFTVILLIQSCVSLIGYNIVGFILAGIFACLSPYISAFFLFGLLLQEHTTFIYHGFVRQAHALNFLTTTGIIILFIMLLINIVLGAASGALAFQFGKKLKKIVGFDSISK